MDLQAKSISTVSILSLSGRFDALTSSRVQTWIEEVVKTTPPHLVLNLGEVTFIDSTALAVLVAGMKRARQDTGDLRLCNLQHPVRMIFELTRLDKAFEIFSSEEEAVKAFALA